MARLKTNPKKTKSKPKVKVKVKVKPKSRIKKSSKPNKKKIGRRTTLTKKIQNDLVKIIQAGNYYVTACRYIGLADSTFYKWLSRGEEEILRLIEIEEKTGKIEEPSEGEFIYVEFLEAIKRAESSAEIEAIKFIKRAYGDSWQAAMTFLERRHSDRWRRKERLELTGDDGDSIQVHLYLPDSGRKKKGK